MSLIMSTTRRVAADPDPFATLVASLSPRVWIDAHGGTHLTTTGSLIDAAVDKSGSGLSPAASGSLRPYYDPTAFGGRGGMIFSGAQQLLTPAFLCQPGTSGAVVWNPSATNQAALEFGPLNSHVLVFAEAGFARVRAPAAGDQAQIAWTSGQLRMTWRTSTGGVIRAIINGGVHTSGGASAAVAQTAPLSIGMLGGGYYPLVGAVGEVLFADAEWSDAEMDALDAALAPRWS